MEITERDLRLILSEVTRHERLAQLQTGRLAQDHIDAANAMSKLIAYWRQHHDEDQTRRGVSVYPVRICR